MKWTSSWFDVATQFEELQILQLVSVSQDLMVVQTATGVEALIYTV